LSLHARLGHELIPLHRWDKRDAKGRARGKSPRDAKWTTANYADFNAALHILAGGNVGVRLTPSDLVIDVDPRNFAPGDDPLKRLCDTIGLELLHCPVVETGGGGKHIYLTKPADKAVSTKLEGYPGIEIKSAGAQLVAAGSVHPETQRNYEWEFLCAETAPPAPEQLFALAARPAAAKSERPAECGQHSPTEIAKMLAPLDPAVFKDYARFIERRSRSGTSNKRSSARSQI
jgi:hypothetical protein